MDHIDFYFSFLSSCCTNCHGHFDPSDSQKMLFFVPKSSLVTDGRLGAMPNMHHDIQLFYVCSRCFCVRELGIGVLCLGEFDLWLIRQFAAVL